MKRLILTTILPMLALAAVAQSNISAGRYQLTVGDFTSLQVGNGINVEYVSSADSAGTAVIFASGESTVKNIIFDNNGKGKLLVQLSTDIAVLQTDGLPTVRVYSQFLQEVRNDGDSTLRIVRAASTPKLKMRLLGNGRIVADSLDISTVNAAISTGSGTITLSGKCVEANLNCTGTGLVDAQELESAKVNCSLWGTGTIKCWVNDGPIKVKGSGTGKIYYRGTASKINSYQVGTIKTLPIDQAQ